MSKRKLDIERIIGVLKQLEAGRTAMEMAREVGVSQQTVRRRCGNADSDMRMSKPILLNGSFLSISGWSGGELGVHSQKGVRSD